MIVNGQAVAKEEIKRLSAAYWWVVGIGAVFTLARFSEAFLILRASQGGLPLALTCADLVLAHSNAWGWLALGVALWGLHMGITQGLLARIIADTAPKTCAALRTASTT